MAGPRGWGAAGGIARAGAAGRVQRHTVEHIFDVSPFVQILDVPVPADGEPIGGSPEDARHCDP